MMVVTPVGFVEVTTLGNDSNVRREKGKHKSSRTVHDLKREEPREGISQQPIRSDDSADDVPEAQSDLDLAIDTEVFSIQNRGILTNAFEHLLEQVPEAGRHYVEIQTIGTVTEGMYHYLANGSGRGGSHYLRGLTPDEKAEIRYLADSNGLSILVEGDTYLSVSLERPDVESDVTFTEQVLTSVFGSTMADIIAIDDVIGSETVRSWPE